MVSRITVTWIFFYVVNRETENLKLWSFVNFIESRDLDLVNLVG